LKSKLGKQCSYNLNLIQENQLMRCQVQGIDFSGV